MNVVLTFIGDANQVKAEIAQFFLQRSCGGASTESPWSDGCHGMCDEMSPLPNTDPTAQDKPSDKRTVLEQAVRISREALATRAGIEEMGPSSPVDVPHTNGICGQNPPYGDYRRIPSPSGLLDATAIIEDAHSADVVQEGTQSRVFGRLAESAPAPASHDANNSGARRLSKEERRGLVDAFKERSITDKRAVVMMQDLCGVTTTSELTVAMRDQLVLALEEASKGVPF